MKVRYSQPHPGLTAVFLGRWFSVSLRFTDDWALQTVRGHLVHSPSQIGPSKASCPAPCWVAFWVSLRMETPQSRWTTYAQCSDTPQLKKKFKNCFLTYRNYHISVCAPCLWSCHLWRVSVQQKARARWKLLFYPVRPSACLCPPVCKSALWFCILVMSSHLSLQKIGWALQ